MSDNRIVNEIAFHADTVAALQEAYTSDSVVHGIYFGRGDPESGGEHWNFTRMLGDHDEGVCVVKEVQQSTVYGGITSVSMSRRSMRCEFDAETAHLTKTRALVITYDVDDSTWDLMRQQAEHVFRGQAHYSLAP